MAEPVHTVDPRRARIVFLGTGSFAVPSFQRLLDLGYNVVLLVTQPERPQGRKQEIVPHPIRVLAEERGVPVFQPQDVNAPEAIRHIAAIEPDLFVLAAYGQILSADLLAVPRIGSLNIHASLLPYYRGAAPVNWAIYNGETETGVTIIEMSPKVDAGGILLQRRVRIGEEETAGELLERLSLVAADMIPEAVDGYVTGRLRPVPQPPGRYPKAPKLRKEHGRLDWRRTAEEIVRHVRAMNPWPGCFTWVYRRSGKPFKLLVWRARVADRESTGEPGRIAQTDPSLLVETGRGLVELLEVQPESKRRLTAADFVRGYRLQVGDRLGDESRVEASV